MGVDQNLQINLVQPLLSGHFLSDSKTKSHSYSSCSAATTLYALFSSWSSSICSSCNCFSVSENSLSYSSPKVDQFSRVFFVVVVF